MYMFNHRESMEVEIEVTDVLQLESNQSNGNHQVCMIHPAQWCFPVHSSENH